jgi:hypothetical protein
MYLLVVLGVLFFARVCYVASRPSTEQVTKPYWDATRAAMGTAVHHLMMSAKHQLFFSFHVFRIVYNLGFLLLVWVVQMTV